jgi:hypothetical protein
MKRTILAAALATGALAVPAVALATSGDDPATQQGPTTAPVQQQDEQQPRRHDCPEGQGNGSAPQAPEGQGDGSAPQAPDSGSSDTLL